VTIYIQAINNDFVGFDRLTGGALREQYRETGEVVNGVGADVTFASAMVTHRLSERH
jgi:hypothetical protein